MVPLYQSVLSGLLIGLRGELAGSLGVYFYWFIDKYEVSVIFNKDILIILMSMLLMSCSYLEKNKSVIIITNESQYLVTDIVVNYTSSIRTDLIGDLPANTSYKYTLQHSDSEDSIYIGYIDKNKEIHFESVIPYGGKYDKKQYTFNIR